MSPFYISVIICLVVFLVFRHVKNQVNRDRAAYGLYAVRDELICLVAEEKLDEDSQIFQYYYSRINKLLAHAPKVGLDDALDAFLSLQSTNNFEKALKESDAKAQQMLDLVMKGKENEYLKEVIANYYAAAKCMMLTHSSLFKFIYVAHIKYPFLDFLRKVSSKKAVDLLRVVDHASQKEKRFRDLCRS